MISYFIFDMLLKKDILFFLYFFIYTYKILYNSYMCDNLNIL